MGALEHFEALLADTHDTRTGILPRDLVRIIEVLIAAKGHEQAALLCGAATSPRRSARRFPVAEAALQVALGEVRHILGDEELQRLMVEGADLDEAAIVAVALEAIQQVTRK
jgi:hypothetical protein